jgi:hypothetical protein
MALVPYRAPVEFCPASLDAANRFLSVTLCPHHYVQPSRQASVQKTEADTLEIHLVRRLDVRAHLPYEHKQYAEEMVARNSANYYRPKTVEDEFVWSLALEKARALTKD